MENMYVSLWVNKRTEKYMNFGSESSNFSHNSPVVQHDWAKLSLDRWVKAAERLQRFQRQSASISPT